MEVILVCMLLSAFRRDFGRIRSDRNLEGVRGHAWHTLQETAVTEAFEEKLVDIRDDCQVRIGYVYIFTHLFFQPQSYTNSLCVHPAMVVKLSDRKTNAYAVHLSINGRNSKTFKRVDVHILFPKHREWAIPDT